MVASNAGSIGQGGATASGAGTGSGAHRGGSAGSAALAGEPSPPPTRDQRLAAVQLAAGNLERVRRARKLMLDAERDPRLLPPSPTTEGLRDVRPPP